MYGIGMHVVAIYLCIYLSWSMFGLVTLNENVATELLVQWNFQNSDIDLFILFYLIN